MEEEDEIIEVDAEDGEVKQRKIVLSYMDVSGFRLEEVNVKLQGTKIVVSGEYKNRDEDSEHHQFVRSVPIPAGIDKATIKSDMENDGRHLCIWAQSESAADAEPREIPINVKQTVKKEAQIKVEPEIHH